MDNIDATPIGSPSAAPTTLPSNPTPPAALRHFPGATSPLTLDSQFTHESKLPPLSLDAPKSRLARGPALAALAGIGSAVAIATAFAFSPSPKKPIEAHTDQASTSQPIRLPDVIQDHQPPAPGASAALPAADSPQRIQTPPSEAAQQRLAIRRAREDALHDELEKALTSPLYANIDDPFTAEPRPTLSGATPQAPLPIDRRAATPTEAANPGGSTAASNTSGDPNLQGHKNDFLSQTEATDPYLATGLIHPRSPYELKAGTIIPTVLITGLDSDLPGNILGQVSENVYDTVSGNYLLIPQGSKLIAKYDSILSYGQERVLVCWQRIIRPDGTSLSLDCMPGIDKSGYAGFADQVDHHWWRVLTGIALGSLLSAGIQAPQGNVTGYVPTIGQAMAGNAAGAVNQAGQQITSKALNIQPTIKIRPGFSVSVFVTKDLVLEPYSTLEP
jgi:type IV secretory pathway VirB10-like protein